VESFTMNKTLRNCSVLLAIFLAGCGGSSLDYSDLKNIDLLLKILAKIQREGLPVQ